MALHLGRALASGIKRGATRTGGTLLGALFVLQILTQLSVNTMADAAVPPGEELPVGLTLPVSGAAAGGLFLVVLVLTAIYFVVVSRAFARPVRELDSLPSELYTRRIGRATLSLIVGGIIATVLIAIGLLLFVLPGLFLATCFLFFMFAVSVEDRGVVAGLKRSWGLSKGNRLKLGLIVLVGGAIGAVVGIVGTLLELAGVPAVADVVSAVVTSVLYVFLYGVIADAYLQLRDDGSGGTGRSGTADTLGTTAD